MQSLSIIDLPRAILAAHRLAIIAHTSGRDTMTAADWDRIEDKVGVIPEKHRNEIECAFYTRLNREADK